MESKEYESLCQLTAEEVYVSTLSRREKLNVITMGNVLQIIEDFKYVLAKRICKEKNKKC